MPAGGTPLTNAKFTLNTLGVAGFFGGQEAISAMRTVNLYRMRRWLGWYNSPGSYSVARHYGQAATDRIWCALFPGVRSSPSKLLGLDGTPGPEFFASKSGTHMRNTNHPAYIFMEGAKRINAAEVDDGHTNRNRPSFVTIAYLDKLNEVKDINAGMLRQTSLICAFLTISFNVGACIACGIFRDWFCFFMILMGIVINGASCCTVGSAQLVFDKPQPSIGSPPGDGFLIQGSDVVILLGKEDVVGSLISGRLELKYSKSEKRYLRAIGICSLFQYVQGLVQLLLVPQGTLFGQIMFLSTLAVSWIYNCYLSYLDKLNLQDELLKKALGDPQVVRFELKTWTRMAVSVLLILKPENPKMLLNRLLSNDTKPWRIWKREVLKRLSGKEYDFTIKGVDNEGDRKLLKDLYEDVEFAYKAYNGQKFARAI